MMVLKNYWIVLLLLLLISCGEKSLTIDNKPVEVIITQPARPKPIKLSNITWKILTVDNTIYYGLRVKDYEILAVNMEEIKRYIKAQNNIVTYYEKATR